VLAIIPGIAFSLDFFLLFFLPHTLPEHRYKDKQENQINFGKVLRDF